MFPFHPVFSFLCFRTALPGASIPDPPQCEQLLDCSWPEQGGGADQYEPLCPSEQVEPALEATEFTVRTIESESRPVSIKRNQAKLEGSVAIEMSAQPLLELTPMAGSAAIALTRLLCSLTMHHRARFRWCRCSSHLIAECHSKSLALMSPLCGGSHRSLFVRAQLKPFLLLAHTSVWVFQ